MHYVLILHLLMMHGGSLSTTEFNSKETCEQVGAEAIKKYGNQLFTTADFECIPVKD